MNRNVILAVCFAIPPVSLFAQDRKAIDTRPNLPRRTDRLGDPLPEQAMLRLGTRRFQHPSGPTQIILSSDEQTVVSLMRGVLFGWDAETGKELWRQSLNEEFRGIRVGAAGYGIRPLTTIPNSDLVAFCHQGGVSTVDPQTGTIEALLADIAVMPKSIDVSVDGSLFAIGGAERLIVLDRTGNTVYEVDNQPDAPLGDIKNGDRLTFGGDFSYARFSPDGQYLAVVNSEQPETVQLFDAVNGYEVRVIQGTARIVRMDFSPNGQQIVTTERDIATRLYDVATGERRWELILPPSGRSESYTSCVTFRPDGKQIAVGAPLGSDFRIRLLDPTTGKETGSLSGSSWKPWTMQYLRDSKTLYGSGWDGMIRRWELDANEQLAPPGGVRATGVCAMSRNADLMAFVDDQHEIHLVSLPSAETLSMLGRPETRWGQVAFSHDGTQIAAGGSTLQEMAVVVWDVATQTLQHAWSWPKGNDSHADIEALAWSRNGTRVAAASFRQSAAYVWDLPTDRRIATLPHRRVYGMDITHDGRTLITAGWDKHIRTWDCETGEQLREVAGAAGDTRMYGVKLSHNEALVAAIDMTNSIRLFNRRLEPLNVIAVPGSFTFGALQFSSNDHWLAVGTHSRAHVYDVHSGERVWQAGGHEEYVYTVDFGADDRTLLSGGTDGVCYLWSLETADVQPPTDPAQGYAQLVGENAEDAFQAYLRLSKDAETTVPLLKDELIHVELADIPDEEFQQAFSMLDSRDPGLREKGQRRIREWGLSGYERLMREAQSKPLAMFEQAFADTFAEALSTRYLRAARLLKQIDPAAAPNVIDAIQAETQSALIRDTFRAAMASDR